MRRFLYSTIIFFSYLFFITAPRTTLAQSINDTKMNEYLYLHELDDDLFPEFAFGLGNKGIKPFLIKADSDSRIPAPKDASLLLLVIFRLAASINPNDAWLLEINRTALDGRITQMVIDLLDEPLEGNYQRIGEDEEWTPPPPGLIYRGAFWLDLSKLLNKKILDPSDMLRIRYGGNQVIVTGLNQQI